MLFGGDELLDVAMHTIYLENVYKSNCKCLLLGNVVRNIIMPIIQRALYLEDNDGQMVGGKFFLLWYIRILIEHFDLMRVAQTSN